MPDQSQPPSLYDLLRDDAPDMEIVDIGAMDVGEEPPYSRLMRPGKFRIVGFEPIENECAALNAKAGPGRLFLPYFIGDGSERTFHINSAVMTSSFFQADPEVVNRFNSLGELMRTVRTERVRTRRLDDIAELTRVDFLKADVQGAELEVLRGGRRVLSQTKLIECEVNFVPMYRDMPLWSDIDAEMRAQGFLFHTFSGLAGRAFKPVVVNNDPTMPVAQLLWGNALYVRDFRRFKDLSPDDLLRLALIMHEQYRSFDLVALALQHHKSRGGKDFWSRYMQALMGSPPIGEPSLA